MEEHRDSREGTMPLSFSEFLEKMKDPKAADLVRSIKVFIKEFESPSKSTSGSYDATADGEKVQHFVAHMEQVFMSHPLWKGNIKEINDQAVEGLEKYVMSKIWAKTFAIATDDRDRDDRYARLCHALGFLDLETLMGDAVNPDQGLMESAQDQLLRMDKYKAPRDKLLCLVNVKTIVEEIIATANRDGFSIGGGDAFFPVLLLVVIRAKPQALASNIEYIRRFRGQRLSGQFDFMLSNLESVAMYLDTVDWRDLKISEDAFLSRLAEAGIPEAELQLRTKHLPSEEKAQDVQKNQEAFESDSKGDQDDTREETAFLVGEESQHQSIIDDTLAQQIKEEARDDAIAITKLAVEEKQTDVPVQPRADPSLLESYGDSRPLLSPTTTNNFSCDDGSISLKPQIQHERQEYNTIKSLIEEGTPLVLHEESEGLLQQKYPWIYANAEDLRVGDVTDLLSDYRDLVLKHEALRLALEQQLPISADNVARETKFGEMETSNQQNARSSVSEAAGSLVNKLASSWGPRSQNVEEPQSTLLHSLFGRSSRQSTGRMHPTEETSRRENKIEQNSSATSPPASESLMDADARPLLDHNQDQEKFQSLI